MTTHLYLFTTLLLITASPLCYAMKRTLDTTTSETITALTVIKRPQSVICFPDNIVAILSSDGCSLCNFSTNKKIKQLSSYTYSTIFQSIAAHPNKKTLALWHKNNLEIYDVATKSKIWENNSEYWRSPPIFNPMDDTILISNSLHIIKSFNYKNNSYQSYTLAPDTIKQYMKMTFHPTKQETILSSASLDTIKIVPLTQNPLIKKNFSLGEDRYLDDSKYSYDGSLIAINSTSYGCFILDSKSNSGDWLSANNPSQAIVFHPSSFILATLLAKHICYWNAKTRQLITSTPLNEPLNNYSYPESFYTEPMDFSCDGTKLVIAFSDKCLVLEVPFEVLSGEPYQLGTKNKCIYALWALKHYICAKDTLPQDIKYLLTCNLLAASQFSLTNS